MFSQAPREKGRPRPATLRVSAFLAFKKSFRQEPANSGIGKDFPNLPKKRRWVLRAAISRALRVCVLRDHSGTTKEIKVMQAQTTVQNQFINSITQGDCIQVMREMPANSVDFILTDPPYLVNYRDRDGRTIQNDAKADWLKPAMREAHRVLKQNRLAVMFYGWTKVDAFFEAWKEAGFQPVGHIVFRKKYSSKSRFFSYQHEQAYLLAKGRPPLPKHGEVSNPHRLAVILSNDRQGVTDVKTVFVHDRYPHRILSPHPAKGRNTGLCAAGVIAQHSCTRANGAEMLIPTMSGKESAGAARVKAARITSQ
jgi:hypothetical protein